MKVLVDTNVLVKLLDVKSGEHSAAWKAIIRLRLDATPLYVVPQVLYEFWVVSTRPVDNRSGRSGLGFDTEKARKAHDFWKRFFRLKSDSNRILQQWEDLVAKHSVIGREAHDARIVAAMMSHGIDSILTFNKKDFERYGTIKVLAPDELTFTESQQSVLKEFLNRTRQNPEK